MLDVLSIEEKIKAFFALQEAGILTQKMKIEIVDDSEKHKHHTEMLKYKSDKVHNGEQAIPSHLRIKIVHPIFEGMSRVERHRLMHNLLKEEYDVIHSISLTLIADSEE